MSGAPQAEAAVSYFGSASTPADNSTNTASPTVVTPPGGMQVGDLVILYAYGSGTTDPAISATGGQTWTSNTVRTSAGGRDGRTFWARFNGTWSADPSVTMPGTSNNIVVMHVFRPSTTRNLWEVDVAETNGSFVAGSSPFTKTITGVSTITNGAVVVAAWSSDDDDSWGTLSGSGWSVLGGAQYRNTSGFSDGSQSFAYQVKGLAGATGDVSKNQTANGGDAGVTSIMAFREVVPPIAYFGSASTPADNGTNTASPTAVTPPTNMEVGDLVILYAYGNGTTDPAISATGGQTWTSNTVRTSAGGRDGRTFWARFNGTWSADPSVTMPGISNNIVVMHVFRPSASTNVWEVDVAETNGSFVAGSSPFTKTITGVTTLTDGAVAVAAWSSDDDDSWGALAGAGWSVLGTAQYRNTSGANDGSQSFAYQVKTTAGATGNVSKDQTANGGDAGVTAIMAFKQIEAPPEFESLTADDPDDADTWLSNGDTLTMLFDKGTNAPLVGTKAQIDGLLTFQNPLGTDYTGAWSTTINTNDTLTLTLVDASGGSLANGDSVTVIADGVQDLKDTAVTTAASTATGDVTGDWGVKPEERTIYVSDSTNPAQVFIFVPETAAVTLVGSLPFSTYSLARRASDGLLFSVENVTDGRVAYMDPATGTSTLLAGPGTVGASVPTFYRLTFAANDTLYGMDNNNVLYTVNTTTGTATTVCNPVTGDMATGGGGDFSFSSNGTLYALAANTLYTIDIGACTSTVVGAGTGDSTHASNAQGDGDDIYGPTYGGTPHAVVVDNITGVGTVGADVTPTTTIYDAASLPKWADLSIVKDDAGATFNVGANGTYTITVSNSGPDAAAAPIVVTDTLPTGLTYVSASGTGWACGASGQVVTCTNTSSLASGNSLPTITLTVLADVNGVPNVTNTATVEAATYDNDLTDNSDSEITPVVNAPNLSTSTKAENDADNTVARSQVVLYTVTITNTGSGTGTGISLTDSMDADIASVGSFGFSDCGSPSNGTSGINISITSITVAVGTPCVVTWNATVSASAAAGATIPNTATISAAAEGGAGASPSATTLTVESADLSVSKARTSGSATPNVGDTIEFTVTISNAGPHSATSVVLTDLLPSGLTYVSDTPSQGSYVSGTGVWTVGTIAAAGSANIVIDATVNSSGAGTTVTNAAQVTTVDQADPDSTPNDGTGDDYSTSAIDVQSADLSVSKARTIGSATPNVGDSLQFTVTISNAGPHSATSVVLTDLLPSGLTYVSNTPSQGSYVSGTGVWTVGTIAAAGSANIVINATVNSSGAGTTVTNIAQVTSSGTYDPDSTPNDGTGDDYSTSAITVQSADLSVSKARTSGSATPNVGDTIEFTVTISNAGPHSATSVVLTDLLPSGLTYVSDTPSQGSYVSGTGVWTVGTIAAVGSANIVIEATVNAGTAGTTITNIAQVTSSGTYDPDSTPNDGTGDDYSTSAIDVQSADLSVSKARTIGSATPNVGDSLQFTVTISNAGPHSATSVVLTDLLPSGLTYVSNTPSQGSYVSGTGVWTVGTIANAADATLDITATVDLGTAGDTITNTAAITAVDQGDPNPGDESDDADIVVDAADLTVTKDVDDSTPNEGDTVVYTVTIDNAGPQSATGIVLADLLPTGVTYVSHVASQGTYVSGTGVWTVGTIANAADATLDITATVDLGTVGTTITNTATITAVDQGDPNPGDESDDADIVVDAADLTVTKDVDDSTPNEGDTVVYTVTIDNAGPQSATGIVLADLLPTGVTYVSHVASQGTYVSGTGVWTVGTIANAADATLDITATVDLGTAGDTITNTAAITAVDQGDPNPGDESDDADIVVDAADLAVTKDVDDSTPNEGDTVVYTVTIDNAGPQSATGIVLADLLPTGVTYVSHVASQGTYVSGTGVWTVGTIANAADATLDITATVDLGTVGTTITNTATITAVDQGDPNPGDESDDADIVVDAADLAVTKDVDDSTPNEGDTVVYTVTIDNAGPQSATGIVLADLLPTGVTYVSHVASQGTYVSGTGVWTVGTIANAADATLDITATVDLGTAGDTITNTATITAVDQGDPNPGDESDDADIVVDAADLTVTKDVDDATPDEGDTVVYTVTIANAGPDSATGIVLADLLPTGVTYVSHVASQGTYVSGTGVWTVGTIANAADATLDVTATVDLGTAGDTITNTATITAVDQGDPNPGDESDDADIDVNTIDSADLTVTKDVDDATPDEGDTVVYTVTIANAGPDSATGIVLADLLPTGVTYVSHVASQGTYVSGTGVWTVGTIANAADATLDVTATVDLGTAGDTITNTATITAVDQGDPNPGDESDDADVVVGDLPVLSTSTKSDDDADNVVSPGQTITYTITVINSGEATGTGIAITDTLDSELENLDVISITSCGTPVDGSTSTELSITGATVAVGTPCVIILTADVKLTAPGESSIVNSAAISAAIEGGPGANPSSDTLTVNRADLSLVKLVDDATPDEGGTIVYTITVSNAGESAATGVVAEDLLPSGLTYVSHVASQGTYLPGTGVWTVGTIASGANKTLTITATVDAGTGGDTITNTAEVTASNSFDPDSTPDNASSSEDDQSSVAVVPNVPSADLSVLKTIDDATTGAGDHVTYTITVSNAGPDAATGVVVTDLLPSTLSFTSASATQGTYVSGTGIWTVGTIANGAHKTLTIHVTVLASAAGHSVTNTAEVTDSDQDDPDSTPDNSSGSEDDQDGVSMTVRSSGGGGGGGGGGGCVVDCVPPPPPPPPVEPPAPVPTPTCDVCSRLSYDVYIINPDGTARHTGTPWVEVTDLGNGVRRYAFEDRTINPADSGYDHNDAVVDVDFKDCQSVKFTFVSSEAGWHHAIRFKVAIDGVEQSDTLVADDDKVYVGTSKQVNATTGVDQASACESEPVELPPVVPPVEVPIAPVQPAPTCDVCSHLAYDVYIVNPDGSERHTGTPWVRVTDLGNGVRRYSFEDKTLDPADSGFDHNDSVIDVDLKDCANVRFTFVSADAGWKHRIQFRVSLDVVLQSDMLVASDDDAVRGTTRTVDAKSGVTAPLSCVAPIAPPIAARPPSACSTTQAFTRNLGRDIAGDDVLSLQRLLQCLGFFPTTVAPNGNFGPVTEASVGRLQASLGLPVNGVAGPATRAALAVYLVAPSAEPISCSATTPFVRDLGRGDFGVDVLDMQTLLQCLGFFPTTVAPNGNFGPVTEAAVKAYQAAHGMAADGSVGPVERGLLDAYIGR